MSEMSNEEYDRRQQQQERAEYWQRVEAMVREGFNGLLASGDMLDVALLIKQAKAIVGEIDRQRAEEAGK